MLAFKGRWSAVLAAATAAMLVVACAGSAGVPASSPASPAAVSPAVSPEPEGTTPTAQPTLTGTDPSDDGTGEADAFQPPEPSCPAPATAVTAPVLTVSAAGQAVGLVMLSSTVLTCGTTGVDDRADVDPTDALLVPAVGSVTVALPDGWRFLWWEGFDTYAGYEGNNLWSGRETPGGPRSIQIPLRFREGNSYLGVSAWAIRADGRVVAQIGGEALLRVR